jgi:hypothetical protein
MLRSGYIASEHPKVCQLDCRKMSKNVGGFPNDVGAPKDLRSS